VGSALALALASGCGCGDDSGSERTAAARTQPPSPPPPTLRPARCPAELVGCRVASGRILYVERVDPDGDGDAHFVLASRASITAPGVSVIDVRRGLRPRPLPAPGDRISAAGPVQVGSYGQRQIHAVRLRVAERP
jgi:hypothetical protein